MQFNLIQFNSLIYRYCLASLAKTKPRRKPIKQSLHHQSACEVSYIRWLLLGPILINGHPNIGLLNFSCVLWLDSTLCCCYAFVEKYALSEAFVLCGSKNFYGKNNINLKYKWSSSILVRVVWKN